MRWLMGAALPDRRRRAIAPRRRGAPSCSRPARSAPRSPAGMSSRMPARGGAVEVEGAVGLGERVVAADLDRAVAAVRRPSSVVSRRPSLRTISPGATKRSPGTMAVASDRVEDDRAAAPGGSCRRGRASRSPCSSAIGSVHGDELGPVGERAFDLHLVDHLGHAVHHLARGRGCGGRHPSARRRGGRRE